MLADSNSPIHKLCCRILESCRFHLQPVMDVPHCSPQIQNLVVVYGCNKPLLITSPPRPHHRSTDTQLNLWGPKHGIILQLLILLNNPNHVVPHPSNSFQFIYGTEYCLSHSIMYTQLRKFHFNFTQKPLSNDNHHQRLL